MSTLFLAAPAHWTPLADTLRERGNTVHSLLGGRPNYDWYARWLQFEQEYRAMRLVLDKAQAGTTDLERSCRAIPDSADGWQELQEKLQGLSHALARAYALRRAVADVVENQGCTTVVTTCTYDPIGRIVVQAARDRGVPVVHVTHACQTAAPQDAWYCASDPGDVLCVPGERDKQWWVDCLASDPPELAPRIEVTGHPLWDIHWSNGWEDTIPHQPPVVLWACESGASPAQTPRIWQSREAPINAWQSFLRALGSPGLRDFQRGGQPLHLLLKVREGESHDLIDTWVQEAKDVLGTERVTVSEEPVHRVVPRADVVLCQDSNLGVEGLILGVPVVSLTRDGGGLFTTRKDGTVTVLHLGAPGLEGTIAHVLDYLLKQTPTRAACRDAAMSYARSGGTSMDDACQVIEEVASHAPVPA